MHSFRLANFANAPLRSRADSFEDGQASHLCRVSCVCAGLRQLPLQMWPCPDVHTATSRAI